MRLKENIDFLPIVIRSDPIYAFRFCRKHSETRENDGFSGFGRI